MPSCSSVGVSQSQTPWEAGPSLHTLPAPGDDPGSNPLSFCQFFVIPKGTEEQRPPAPAPQTAPHLQNQPQEETRRWRGVVGGDPKTAAGQ